MGDPQRKAEKPESVTEPTTAGAGGSPPNRSGRKKSALGWGAAGLIAVLSKFKGVALLLLKAGKPILTMAASVGAYALLYPWQFALGFVLLLLVHEMGHYWAAKRIGLPVSAPLFIPFLGAAILMKRHPKSAAAEAYMALGGPILGTVGAFVCYVIGLQSDSQLFFALAYVGFMLNLINLMPVRPLDGGRIVGAVSRWLYVVGAVGGPFLVWYTKSLLFLFIWIWFLWEMYVRFFRSRPGKVDYRVDGEFRAKVDSSLPSWYTQGSEHRRELPFLAYCKLNGEHAVEFWWEALEFRGELSFNEPCIIRKVYVTKVEEPNEAGYVIFTVRAEGQRLREDDTAYYDVLPAVRWKTGTAYGTLVVVLLFMIWKMGEVGL